MQTFLNLNFHLLAQGKAAAPAIFAYLKSLGLDQTAAELAKEFGTVLALLCLATHTDFTH